MVELLATENLTAGEALEVDRRRTDLTQAGAAGLFDVPPCHYRRWELDELEGPRVRLGPLSLHEQAFVVRRRSGLTVRQVAEQMGLSRQWISEAERGRTGSVEVLLEWWARVGWPSNPQQIRRGSAADSQQELDAEARGEA